MKTSIHDKVTGKFHKEKGETHEKLRKPTNDPTLEGKDENKVGRIERKIGRNDEALEK